VPATVIDEQPSFVEVRHVLRLPRRAVVPIETESERFNVFVTLVNVGQRSLARDDPLDDCPTCFISMLLRKYGLWSHHLAGGLLAIADRV